ncbi:hypothetical protein CCACVL1_24060 [Corchorus capsularis]|uniref:FAS1 domain-containing protein n=1 Tax=Corchorus capsularis TaxID=210143 RepID=A0A1R3GR12_COCAP|nr:hypothetical protein CCACVL1_24060 [Corchorus capsularis]
MGFGVSRPNPTCIIPSENGDDHSFREAISVLRSRKHSVMASFLDLQLMGFKPNNAEPLTLFAPLDDAIKMKGDYIGNFSEYQSIFFRHVLPCKLSWADLVNLSDGTVLGTYLEGFKIHVTKSGGNLLINGVGIAYPDLFYGESIVVHGLQEVLVVPEILAESPSHMGVDQGEF